MKHRIILFTGIFILSIFHACADITESDSASAAQIAFFVGTVRLSGSEAAVGMPVNAGDTLTTGPRSSCDITLGNSLLRLKESTELTVTNALLHNGKENTDITLDSGALLCKPGKLLSDESFIVRTPTSVAAVRGTQFGVRTDAAESTRIKVFEGTVSVVPRVGKADDSLDDLMKHSTQISENSAAVVTVEDKAAADTAVNSSLESGSTLQEALQENKEHIALRNERIETFDPSDFQEDIGLIEVQEPEKPKPAKRVVQKPRPVPETLVVSRYEIYKVQKGTITDSAALLGEAITHGNRIIAASRNRIYGARPDGTIVWERSLQSIEGISRNGNRIMVETASGTKTLLLSNGRIVR